MCKAHHSFNAPDEGNPEDMFYIWYVTSICQIDKIQQHISHRAQ